MIPALIKKCVDAVESGDDKIDVWGTGTASREYLYVEDAAEAIVLAAELHEGIEPINLGTDREVTIRETVETSPASSASRASCAGIRPSQTDNRGGASTRRVPSSFSAGGLRCRSTKVCGAPSTGTSPTGPKPNVRRAERPATTPATFTRRLRRSHDACDVQTTPAASAGARYAMASVSIVSWALSPLGFGTIHSSAPGERLRLPSQLGPPDPERGAVRGDAGDRHDHRPVTLDERNQSLATGSQLRRRQLRRLGGRPGDEVGDADATPDQVRPVGVVHASPTVDPALDQARLQQCRIEAIAGMCEVGPRRRRPQPRVDADEQQPQTRSDEIVDGGIAVRLQLRSRESHERRP